MFHLHQSWQRKSLNKSYLLRAGLPSFLFMYQGTQLCSSVQSACRPHPQPIENRLNCQDSVVLPGRKQGQRRLPFAHWQGVSKSKSCTRCLPNVVPPVFWMWRKTITSLPLILKSYFRATEVSSCPTSSSHSHRSWWTLPVDFTVPSRPIGGHMYKFELERL